MRLKNSDLSLTHPKMISCKNGIDFVTLCHFFLFVDYLSKMHCKSIFCVQFHDEIFFLIFLSLCCCFKGVCKRVHLSVHQVTVLFDHYPLCLVGVSIAIVPLNTRIKLFFFCFYLCFCFVFLPN